MHRIRRAHERGHFDHGWLDTRHTFSFAQYYDPAHMGFRALRVLNDDRVTAGAGFPEHGHRDMEIVTYVLSGQLAHRDSMGNGSVIGVGDVQRMTAGTGVTHSEMNASAREPVHFLQIWLLPQQQGLPPSYEQKHFADSSKQGLFRLVASSDGADGSVRVHQDVRLYAGLFRTGESATMPLDLHRHAWIHVARGRARVDGQELEAGDAMAISESTAVTVDGVLDAEVLLFDLH